MTCYFNFTKQIECRTNLKVSIEKSLWAVQKKQKQNPLLLHNNSSLRDNVTEPRWAKWCEHKQNQQYRADPSAQQELSSPSPFYTKTSSAQPPFPPPTPLSPLAQMEHTALQRAK